MTISAHAKSSKPSKSTNRSKRWTPGRIGTYAFLISAAVFFLLPLYVMLVTSVKPMEEIRQEVEKRGITWRWRD